MRPPPRRAPRTRFPVNRWILAPLTTWRARHLASDLVMDASTAWALARLRDKPEELSYALDQLSRIRSPRLRASEKGAKTES